MREEVPVTARIVIADGDVDDRTRVEQALSAEGYQVAGVGDGIAALAAIESFRPDALLVTLTLGGIDGQSICRRLRSRGSPLPVIVVADRACTRAHMNSLDAGADDFIAKPMATDELATRIRAVVRRAQAGASSLLVVGDVELDGKRRTVTRAGQRVALTLTEYSILELLMRNVDVVLERAMIYERIWGFDLHESSKSLDVHIGAIRRKLECHGNRIIENVRGVGYVLWTPQPVTSANEDLC